MSKDKLSIPLAEVGKPSSIKQVKYDSNIHTYDSMYADGMEFAKWMSGNVTSGFWIGIKDYIEYCEETWRTEEQERERLANKYA